MIAYLDVSRPTVAFFCHVPQSFSALASAVGLFQALYHPEELNVFTAAELAPYLQNGLDQLLAAERREELLRIEPAIGWGPLDAFSELIARYLIACNDHPDALLRLAR